MTGDAMRDVIAGYLMDDARSGPWADREAETILRLIAEAPASARLALARAITPDTHAVVPVEATIEMRWAGNEFHATADIYRAMVKRGAEGGKDA